MKNEIAKQISPYLTDDILMYAEKSSAGFWDKLCEIRITLGRPVMIDLAGELSVLGGGACRGALIADKKCIDTVVNAVTNGSMYSVNDTIKNGFVTIRGGHRIGFCGTAVSEKDEIKHIKDISSVCIRISREITGCAICLKNELYTGSRVSNILIASPPGCGKTTLLRDICRILGNGEYGCNMVKVGIADERSEIAASYMGRFQNDVGAASFVCNGYVKSKAMQMMLRAMSPDVLATDEIGSGSDFKAIAEAQKSGVSVIATAHADSFDDLCAKYGKELISSCFDKIVLLKGKGTVDKIYRRADNDY